MKRTYKYKKRSKRTYKSKKKIRRRRNKSKKRIPKNKTKMRGGLKPSAIGVEVNSREGQDGIEKLRNFVESQAKKGITYPPLLTLKSSELHVPKPEFAPESIEYPIISINDNVIKIDTSERDILNLTADENAHLHVAIAQGKHLWHPKRVQVTIKGRDYLAKTITKDDEASCTITLFEEIPSEFLSEISPGDIATVERNRQGDFVIYARDPSTIRYLDNQLQREYIQRHGNRVGHFSLLDEPSDYEAENVRGDETDLTRGTDKILYAGSIIWREDGRALYYKNDCGRYQPDSADGDYLAKINPQFRKDIQTATGAETGVAPSTGHPKKFYRPHDQMSGLETPCGGCGVHFLLNELRRPKRVIQRDPAYCRDCFPTSPCWECDECEISSEYCNDTDFDRGRPYSDKPDSARIVAMQRKRDEIRGYVGT
jgi:hypothetical protein